MVAHLACIFNAMRTIRTRQDRVKMKMSVVGVNSLPIRLLPILLEAMGVGVGVQATMQHSQLTRLLARALPSLLSNYEAGLIRTRSLTPKRASTHGRLRRGSSSITN